MNDLGELSLQLCHLLQSQGGDPAAGGPAAGDPAAGGCALRWALDDGRWIGSHFEACQQRWVLGVGCATQLQEAGARARLEQALLRVGHASRWARQQTGWGNGQEIELVDCDFPARPAQLTAAAVEDQLQALLSQLDALAAGRPAALAITALAQPHGRCGCGCAQAFSARMHALDATRQPGSTAALELLFDEHFPLRIGLHPRSHHWVLEAFVGDAAALAEPLRRSLVATLLLVNGAVLGRRLLVCSLDGSDRVVVISRWHLDWALQTSVLDWLEYSLRQARRIRALTAAIAMQAAPVDSDARSWP